MKKKKILSISLVFMILLINILPCVKVNAEVAYYDANTVINFNNITRDMIQTFGSYNTNYDLLSGYMKDNIYFNGMDLNNQYIGSQALDRLYSSFYYDDGYGENDYMSFDDIYFKPITYNNAIVPFEDCDYSIDITADSNAVHLKLSLFYNPNGDKFVNVNGVASTSDYYSSTVDYICHTYINGDVNTYGYTVSNEWQNDSQYDTFIIINNNQSDERYFYIYQSTNVSYAGQGVILSDIPLFYTWRDDINTNEDDYLAENGYQDTLWTIRAYFEDIDSTGFITDRRLSTLLSPGNEANLGVVSGSYVNLIAGQSYDSMKLFTAYQLNEYTKNRASRIKLNMDYELIINAKLKGYDIDFSSSFSDSNGYEDSYIVNGSNLITVDLNKVMEQIYIMPEYSAEGSFGQVFKILNDISQNYKIVTGNAFINTILKNGIKVTSTDKLKLVKTSNLFDDAYELFKYFTIKNSEMYRGYKFEPTYEIDSTTNTYSYLNTAELIVKQYLVDEATGDTSSEYVFTYNFLTGDYSDAGGFETDETEDFEDYDSTDSADSDITINSPASDNTAYGGSASAIGINGDVVITAGAGGTLAMIDIPFSEAIEHTPNLKSMYETFNGQLQSYTQESDSMIDMVKDTFSYFPAEMWGYIGFTVVTVCGIATYRFFRGRG